MSRVLLLLILAIFIGELSFSKQSSYSSTVTQFQSAADLNPKIKKSTDDVWKGVDVDINWVVGEINWEACSESQQIYIACALAVQAFSSVLNKNLEVVPVSQLNGKKAYYKTQRLALLETPSTEINTPKEAYEYFKKLRISLNSRFVSSSAEFIANPNKDFEMLLLEINRQAGIEAGPAEYVGVVSKFLELALDPHTSIMPAKKMESDVNGSGDSFVGIGVEFVRMAQGLVVKRIVKGSGSDLAGLRIGDIIVEVDNKSLHDMKDEDIIKLIRGAVNTNVQLVVLRDQKTFDISVTRAKVVNSVLSSEDIKFNGKTYVYIRLTNFMYANICNEFAAMIQKWEKQNISGYVFDLRNNPGGDVKIAGCVGGIFLGNNKTLAHFENQMTGKYMALQTQAKAVTNKPLSVLINSYSASASEVIAGGFRDYGRAYLVGLTTFGKGSYQGCGLLPSQKSLMVCLTQGLFYAPSGISNQTVGVAPDIKVYLNKEPKDAELYALTEAQMYLYPLKSKKMPNPPAGNWKNIAVPTQCIEKLNLDSVYDKAVSTDSYYRDYQLLNGLAAVDCSSVN